MRVAVLAPLLFLSGMAALVLEVAWFRRMAQVSGATSIALGAVLAAVIGGMALGALLFGRRADRVARPIRLYAYLEASIAAIAVASPWWLSAVEPAYVSIHRHLAASPGAQLIVGFAFSAAILALPAILMGGTLPAAAAALRSRPKRRGRDVGWLYAVNTLGGVAGTVAAGFFLLPLLGLGSTMCAAAVLSGTAAVGAFVLGPRAPRVQGPAPGRPLYSSVQQRRAIALYAASGFLGLAAEVTFTRGLVLVFGSTTYAFSTVLAVFLFGIGVGGLVGARLARSGYALRRLEITVPITAALFSLSALGVYYLPRLYLEGYIHLGAGFGTGLFLRVAITTAALLPGTLGLGIAFPLGAQVAAEAGMGRGTGRLYAANTFASVLGSTLAVFVLVPLWGPHYATVAVALTVAALTLLLVRRRLVLIPLAATALCLLPPPETARERLLSGIYYAPGGWVDGDRIDQKAWDEGVDLAFTAYGREATVCVTRWYGRASVLVDGKAVASEQLASDVQHLALLGHVPMAIHDPRKVLVVGLGMGTTYEAVVLHEPSELTVVEIEDAVAKAAAYLGIEPSRLVVADARTHLKATDDRYDVITSDPIHPWVRGGGDLYTREYFEACRDRLAPGGVACQWLPLYQMGLQDVKDVVRSFQAVFRSAAYFTGADLVLVGTVGEDPPPPRTVQGRAGAALEALGASDLAALLVAGHDELARGARDGVVLEDDALRLEFSTPRQVGNQEMPDCLDWVRTLWNDPAEPYLSLLEAQKAHVEGDGAGLSDALERAQAIAPDNGFVKRFAGEIYLRNVGVLAAAGNIESATKFLTAARRRLGDDDRLLGVEADLWERTGESERAAALFEKLVERYPDSAYLRRRLEKVSRP